MIKLRELEKVTLKNGVLIQGLPGIGLVGKIAVDYIIRELNLRKTAEIISDGLLLQQNVAVLVDDEGILKLPTYDFYHYSAGKRDLLFLTAPTQPVTWMQYEIAERVIDYFQMIGGSEVVGVCGTTMGEKENVYFATTNREIGEELIKYGFKPSPGGVITGACGLLPILASIRGLRAYVLMGYTAQIDPDPLAAKRVVLALAKLFQLEVDTSNLDKLIEEIKAREAEMTAMLKEPDKSRRESMPPFYI